jgi:hypothetical protein
MNIEESLLEEERIASALQNASEQSSEQDCQIEDFEGKLSINGYVAIPVYAIDSSILASDDITLKDNGNEIGFLCPVGIRGNTYEVNELTFARLIAYFNDVKVDSLFSGEKYSFKCHYVVIKVTHYDIYQAEYASAAPLWGGFSHEAPTSKYQRPLLSIDIVTGIKIPTTRHSGDLVRAISSSNGFDRFLKYYHQIELLFDVIFVSKIRAMPAESLAGLRDIMRDYQRNELDNLRGIIKEYVNDTNLLTAIIVKAATPANMIVMCEIFQDHSKDGNPLIKGERDLWDSFKTFIASPNPDPVKAKELKLIDKADQELYRIFILKLVSYWIYRIRCSIAHNKIGEFIFKEEDEEFVVVLGEGLLKPVINEMFSNPTLKSLM